MSAAFDAQERAALEAALIGHARRGRTVSYAELAEEIAVRPPHRIHRLTQALEARVLADHGAGLPLLAAIAVGKIGLPGPGFFQLLSALGRHEGADRGGEAAASHAAELQAALDYWGRDAT